MMKVEELAILGRWDLSMAFLLPVVKAGEVSKQEGPD